MGKNAINHARMRWAWNAGDQQSLCGKEETDQDLRPCSLSACCKQGKPAALANPALPTDQPLQGCCSSRADGRMLRMIE